MQMEMLNPAQKLLTPILRERFSNPIFKYRRYNKIDASVNLEKMREHFNKHTVHESNISFINHTKIEDNHKRIEERIDQIFFIADVDEIDRAGKGFQKVIQPLRAIDYKKIYQRLYNTINAKHLLRISWIFILVTGFVIFGNVLFIKSQRSIEASNTYFEKLRLEEQIEQLKIKLADLSSKIDRNKNGINKNDLFEKPPLPSAYLHLVEKSNFNSYNKVSTDQDADLCCSMNNYYDKTSIVCDKGESSTGQSIINGFNCYFLIGTNPESFKYGKGLERYELTSSLKGKGISK